MQLVAVGDRAVGGPVVAAEPVDLVRDVVAGVGEQALAHGGHVHRHPAAGSLGEAQRLAGHDVQHDAHLVAGVDAEVDRLAGHCGELFEQGQRLPVAEPLFGLPAEDDQRGPELVALGARVLVQDAGFGQGAGEAVGRAHREARPLGELGDADALVVALDAAQRGERAFDGLGARPWQAGGRVGHAGIFAHVAAATGRLERRPVVLREDGADLVVVAVGGRYEDLGDDVGELGEPLVEPAGLLDLVLEGGDPVEQPPDLGVHTGDAGQPFGGVAASRTQPRLQCFHVATSLHTWGSSFL